MEEELIRKWKQGDRAAFDEIYECYVNKGMRMAYMISGNHADAEDIVQETFVKCFCNIDKLQEESSFSSWFYTVLTRTAWKLCGKKKREQPQEDVMLLCDQNRFYQVESTEQQVLTTEKTREFRHMLEELPVKQRTVAVLYYYNELSTKEIAGICGCLEGTVKSRLFTARKCFRELYTLSEQNQSEQKITEPKVTEPKVTESKVTESKVTERKNRETLCSPHCGEVQMAEGRISG